MSTKQTYQALLAHETFVRNLARSLVKDPALADDLAQDTWVAALRRPPAVDGSPRGWLTRVMRNQLSNKRRGEVRRASREAQVAREDVDDRQEGRLERLELQQRVVKAVLALPEPQRTVLMMHFYDGMSPSEIARDRRIPAATVRSQLKRGLSAVRTRLDGEHPGGRASWCALLVALRREAPPVVPAAASKGGVLACVGGAALLGVLATQLHVLAGPISDSQVGGVGPATTELQSPTLAPLSLESGRRRALGALPGQEPTTDRAVPTRVAVGLKDASGAPVAQADVWVFQQVVTPEGEPTFASFGPFTSNAAGRIEGPLARFSKGTTFMRWVYATKEGELVGAGGMGSSPAAAQPVAAISVLMVPSRSLLGTVTVPEGVDVDTITVSVHTFHTTADWPASGSTFPRNSGFAGLESVLPRQFECQVDRRGRFEMPAVPAGGLIYLMATGPGLGYASYANVGRGYVPLPDSIHIELKVEALVRGSVTDPGGAVLAGVLVTLQPTDLLGSPIYMPSAATTDSEGQFEISGLPAGAFSISATTQPGEWVMRPQAARLAPGESRNVTLTMSESLRVAGKVVDAVTDQPLAGVVVMAIEPHNNGESPRLGGSHTDETGRFELYLPDGPVGLYFGSVPPGYEFPQPQIVETFSIDELTRPIEDLVLRLEPSGDK